VLIGQAVAGHANFNQQQLTESLEPVSFWRYVTSASFGADVLENWQSEYLQFSLYIFLTVWLLQKGSPESKELDKPGRETDQEQKIGPYADRNSPKWARTRGVKLWLFSNSLGLVMGLIFVLSWLGQSIARLFPVQAGRQRPHRHGHRGIAGHAVKAGTEHLCSATNTVTPAFGRETGVIMNRRTVAVSFLALGLALTGLTGCGSDDEAATAAPAAESAKSAAPAELTVRDPWVKAVDSGMTAAFGTLVNATDHQVTVVGATSTASPLELHEMAMQNGKMVMQPKKGGFVIPARGTHELSPGGDHLMLMKPTAAIKAGDEVSFTLTLDDGKTVGFSALAKPFVGANESYAPSTAPSMSGMGK
jgi:copper(I)-binding protein